MTPKMLDNSGPANEKIVDEEDGATEGGRRMKQNAKGTATYSDLSGQPVAITASLAPVMVLTSGQPRLRLNLKVAAALSLPMRSSGFCHYRQA
ncbi:hypothetical protein JAAARDRAFT_608877 [Jaapia argillacea MUCL 33604]|uniref:Uncharacterized protein n=1 Tax=Jaapia argillacea MUCL 33604 TaxID=933084 RepID=A0A067P518_9AGAM|nr:hypothetical protein JAAARDRAFT_608877 [Jaapia argillacea MUCL 33604]